MNNRRSAYIASLVCLAGGAVQVVYGLLAIPFPYAQAAYGWDQVLWALANVGMIGGAFGLLALDVGRPRWLAIAGTGLTVLGNLIRIAASALLLQDPAGDYVGQVLVSILLVLLGVSSLGAAVLLGRRLSGWQAWTPFLIVGFGLATAATYSIDQFVHFILLGLWGVPWMLLGYAAWSHARGGLQRGGRLLA